jgi:hypothetical protein
MSSPHSLHIIAFDIPYPPNYGGVIDIFYKLKALSKAGVRIFLHCYEYGRGPAVELNEFAEKIYYYPRKTAKSLLFNTYPYIVLSRSSPDLRANLLKDDYPVLMEGLHSTFCLNDAAFMGRHIIVRTHNVEHEYYQNLARVEKNIFKKYYFFNEAGKLEKYEACLSKASAIASISPSDTAHFMHKFSGVHYIPAFHPYDKVKIKQHKSDFAFYHGNLSVGENNEAALFLVEKVFNSLSTKLLIAGNKPSPELVKAVRALPNAELRDDLSHIEIQKLIEQAQCNILPTFQSTGIKLKLINALYSGKHCIVNTPMVVNTGLDSLCTITDSAEDMKEAVSKAMDSPFSDQEILKRREILEKDFSNDANARRIIELLE